MTIHDPNPASQVDPTIAPEDIVTFQDELMEAATDLERLGNLLADAAAQLFVRFCGVDDRIGLCPDPHVEGILRAELAGAVTAMQFEDMSMQMITHAVQRIRSVASLLGAYVSTGDGDAAEIALVRRHCPVAQRQVDAGAIELF